MAETECLAALAAWLLHLTSQVLSTSSYSSLTGLLDQICAGAHNPMHALYATPQAMQDPFSAYTMGLEKGWQLGFEAARKSHAEMNAGSPVHSPAKLFEPVSGRKTSREEFEQENVGVSMCTQQR
jgi:uncharacterized protein YbjT (DUF2867 family)